MPVTEGNVQHRKTILGTVSNFVLYESVHLNNKITLPSRNFSVTGRHFLPQKEISCHREKFPATANNHNKIYPVTGRSFLPQEVNFCHRKKFPATERNILPKEEILCHRKKYPDTGRNFQSKKEISGLRKILLMHQEQIFFNCNQEHGEDGHQPNCWGRVGLC